MGRARSMAASVAPAAPEEVAEAPDLARVLVVDDDSRNLLTITEVLAGIGQIDCASSGEEALRLLLRQEYAVILLDVIMPGLDGYETAGLIRQRESSRATPIIFLTAINKEDAHMLRGYDSGAVDFLFKPFDPMMLRSKVAVFVDLFEKSQAIKQKAAVEQRLLRENLVAKSQKLEALGALRRAEERQEAILRSLPICLVSRRVTPPHDVFFISGAVERLTGFTAEGFTRGGGLGLDRVHPDDRALVESALAGALAKGSYDCQFRWLCADGAYRSFLDQGVVVKDETGAAVEIVGTLLDVTERRHLEDQLLHAQKLEAIGKLTGGLAHDFNNLLASILGGLNLLQRRVAMDGDAGRILEMTRHAAKQGADLVARMLTFSRRQQLNPVGYDPRRLGDALDLLLVPTLGGRVNLRWQIDPDIWPVHVDPGQLELAVMNLVINARDAMPQGGSILVEGENRLVSAPTQDLPAGEYCILRVADTGCGIPPEQLAQVVEPFFTTKEVGRGTGLGLSTAYGFAKQSGGTLRIESELGKGTSVELWLPRSFGTDGERRSQPLAPRPDPPHRKPRSILLVDDSEELRHLTMQQLRDAGYEVRSAGGGAEALVLLEKQPKRFDLIITDFAMPLVSGVDVIRFARSLRPDWPAIIITGYAQRDPSIEWPSGVPVLSKPFEIEDLVAAINTFWNEEKGTRMAAPARATTMPDATHGA